jgi:TrmH family RNA methyltransferase
VREIGRHSAQVKALRRQIRRRPEGRVIVDGARLVGDLVRWQVPIHDLYLNRTVAADEASEALIAPARRAFVLDDEVFASVAPTRSPQGVLAVAEEPRWPRWTGERGCGVWLDGLQDPGNVGAVVRSAAGLGAACVLLGPGCADPWTPVAVRGSAGAVFRVPLEREVTASRAAERVQRHRGQA